MIIHIFKDGTTTTELKDVHVPQEIVERIYNIVEKGKNDGKNQNSQNEFKANR